ncbi:MAG: bifunctional phosphopantothenoylcysteine decarboxylase/phosphopantothenate--cysteine ligase CoaBC [Acidimicrobiales bacterium]
MVGRRIVLGVCGSVAAYKSAELCRALVGAGAQVVPVLTANSANFIGAATLSALSGNPTRSSLWEGPGVSPHTDLARWAEVVLVAPASARLIGDLAHGLAHGLLVNLLLATRSPVILAPAMHTEMWEHPAVVANVARLADRGVIFAGPDSGPLAGGDHGIGRLAEIGSIVAAVQLALGPHDLVGRRVLITSGGTREPIDPVRYLGNRSSGRQGMALVREARARGADVTLITSIEGPAEPGVRVVAVQTAAEMAEAVLAEAQTADVVVMAAAVADFRPAAPAAVKLPKAQVGTSVVLEPTLDIAAELGRRRHPGQVLVGFAAESDPAPAALAAAGEAKCQAKGLDLVVANPVSAMGGDRSEAVLVGPIGRPGGAGTGEEVNGEPRWSQPVEAGTKRQVAARVFDAVVARLIEAPPGSGEGIGGER